MLDPLIKTILNHKSQAISKEAYALWKNNPVTRQLFFDSANAALDSLAEPISGASLIDVGAMAIEREANRDGVMTLLEWSPADVEVTE